VDNFLFLAEERCIVEFNGLELWQNVLSILEEKVSRPSFETWLNSTKVQAYTSTSLSISTPNKFTKEWLETRYSSMIHRTVFSLIEKNIDIIFIDESIKEEEQTDQQDPFTHRYNKYNPNYTFANFVVGQANRFAQAAALAVAEKPAGAYNPLFIYGGVGLGKTHLLHAIGNHINEHNPHLKTLYVSSETFMNEFIDAIREKRGDYFREKYRNIDVLMIDDIQFIGGKEQTQEEFFHTFNTLHEQKKQIVITSDRIPRDIQTLEDRLRSRFEWGLITDIQLPDLETRTAILSKKAKAEKMEFPAVVYDYIAAHVRTNIRELEGALTRVIAFSSLENEDISLNLVERALKEYISEQNSDTISVERIQRKVSEHFGVKVEDFSCKKRTKSIVFPRQVAMYLSRELTELSLPKIGEGFGGRDHSTVLHAHEKITQQMEVDLSLKKEIMTLADQIKNLM
jgi:chromosomal replication initiator protein